MSARGEPVEPRAPRSSFDTLRTSVCACLIALGATLCASPESDTTRAFRYLMGTSVQVAAFGRDELTRRIAVDEAFAAMVEVDRLMSNYRADSELSHLNAAAARAAVRVS